jgi:nitroimidazol reductase NimA-like FMN-containing flavoprotein (pyridoxamine 5'-phosphate oxidase superfamily)
MSRSEPFLTNGVLPDSTGSESQGYLMNTSPSERTTVKRKPQRGAYDRETIHAILDEGLICHVGFVSDGQPCVIPTLYVRIGDHIYLHGSPASRMLRTLQRGVPVSVAVTLIDGLVLARSAMHHSMNYRSVVLFGTASLVDEPGRKFEILRALTEHVIPGRWDDIRQPTPEELRQTLVLSIPISEASAKVRTGDPIDDEEDYELPVWAGVIPLRRAASMPVEDSRLRPGIELPSYVRDYQGPGSNQAR